MDRRQEEKTFTNRPVDEYMLSKSIHEGLVKAITKKMISKAKEVDTMKPKKRMENKMEKYGLSAKEIKNVQDGSLLTKRAALIICRELWLWMAEEKKTDARDKGNWPGWSRYRPMTSACPCCDYADIHYDGCQGNYKWCPLYSLWPQGCMAKGNPYYSFDIGKGTPKNAMQIVEGCEKVLRKLSRASRRKRGLL